MTTDKDQIDVFLEWLDGEELRREWTDYRLAKEAGMSFSVLSRTRAQGILPGWDACVQIASALHVHPITVFRRAGLLPPGPDDTSTFDDWMYLLSQMSPEDQEEMRRIAEMKVQRASRDRTIKHLAPRKSKS